jgi:hypothetical protein
VALNCAAIPEELIESELLATPKARLPGPPVNDVENLNNPTTERSFWMKSAI